MAIKSYKKGQSIKLSKNLESIEFDCSCSKYCSSTLIDDKLVQYIQQIRDHFGKPVKINSAYRCPTHNKKVGGGSNSYHKQGKAADIKIDGVAPAEIAKYAESIGILGIGLYETDRDGHFVHIDTRTTKAFWYGQKQAKRTTFGGSKSAVPTVRQEEEKVTQEQFNVMMNNWLAEQAKKEPGDWSKEARDWAERHEFVKGDENGNKMYKKLLTREEMITVLYRAFRRNIID